MTEIPIEILFPEILARLPAKSVLRFKCVSKLWYSLLSSQSFINKHLYHTTNFHQNPNMLPQISGREFNAIDCEVLKATHTRRLPFISKNKKVVILASFHGLVCAGVLKKAYDSHYSNLYLWNPCTDEFKRLSKTHSNKGCYTVLNRRCGLYYSSFDSDYKLLCVNPDDDSVYIYSLKKDTWRYMVDATNSLMETREARCEYWSNVTWLNDNLFFLKEGYPIDGNNKGGPPYSIIKFDTKIEKFTEILIPSFYKKGTIVFMTSYFLTVQRDKLHLFVKYEKQHDEKSGLMTCFKEWSLNEDEESWTTLETSRPMSGLASELIPIHLMRNKKWFMMDYNFNYSGEYSLYVVNLGAKTNRRKRDDGTCSSYRLVNMKAKPEKVRYIETLVSPNQYMNKPKNYYMTKKKKVQRESLFERLVSSCLFLFADF